MLEGPASLARIAYTQRLAMAVRTVTLKLNRQQLELLDRTIARGVAPDRAAIVRLALRELATRQAAAATRP
jgi:Arc/MetJ-type ribon-helix-helix transcriptional regulator